MSIQSAYRFIRQLRTDQGLRSRLDAPGATVGLAEVLALARQSDFEFSERDLRAAFTHDWIMRSLLHGALSKSENTGSDRNPRPR